MNRRPGALSPGRSRRRSCRAWTFRPLPMPCTPCSTTGLPGCWTHRHERRARPPCPTARRSMSRPSVATSRCSHAACTASSSVYLDNAASSQRPRQVIDAISGYYQSSHANVHRGVHALSQEATDLFEGARERCAASSTPARRRKSIFVRGTTEAINLVAQSYGGRGWRPATRSSSPGSSITPISSPGRWSASRPGPTSR